MRILYPLVLILFVSLLSAQPERGPERILITDVNIFNGVDEQTLFGHILIEGNRIARISADPISVDRSANTRVIDGKGGYVIPGLIDVHTHLLFESVSQNTALFSDFALLNLMAAKAAERQLLRGFTTVRDLGGGALSLAKAIDLGLVAGPRVFASGAFISQTGGHGDFGFPTDVPRIPGQLSYAERNGVTIIADGKDEVRRRVREQLRQGATQIKLMAGGGVSSNYDPLDVAQYSEEELRVAVEEAENWGTYVTVHAYTPKAIQAAVRAGVKCIEHGQLMDEETAKLMAKNDVWFSLQPFLDDEDANPQKAGSENRKKQLQVSEGTDTAYNLAIKYKGKIAWGTDALFNASMAARQGKKLAKMTRWFTPFEVLKMATSVNAELLSLSGERSPYKAGALGVVAEGAYADLILVDGNPLENIELIAEPGKNFKLIVKDGVIYKDAME